MYFLHKYAYISDYNILHCISQYLAFLNETQWFDDIYCLILLYFTIYNSRLHIVVVYLYIFFK